MSNEEENIQTAITHAFHNFKGLSPRPHQWLTVAKIVSDLANFPDSDVNNVKNYLVQHPAGSGKSLTIACLVLCLYNLKTAVDRAGFDTVLVLNDRKVLDTQLADTVIDFLKANDVKDAVRSESSSHLSELLLGNYRVIITTVQKFVQLKPSSFMQKRRVAIIADEAHRTHGSESTSKLHHFLTGSSSQSKLITYFSFTCTPTKKSLEMFGVKKNCKYLPFYMYSQEEAIGDKIILDVLKNYKEVLPKQLKLDDSLAGEERELDIIKKKSEYIVKHFVEKSAELSNADFKAKGMVVVSGRHNILLYKKQMEEIIKTQLEPNQKFDIVCLFAPFTIANTQISETDPEVNGSYSGHGSEYIINQFKDPSSPVKMIIVAEKLQTGFDAPVLSLMYVNKILKGPTAVQTLGRLSRIAKGKESVCVVDFENTRAEMVAAFNEFSYPEAQEPHENVEKLLQAHENNFVLKQLVSKIFGITLSKETLEFAKSIWTGVQPAKEENGEKSSGKLNLNALKKLEQELNINNNNNKTKIEGIAEIPENKPKPTTTKINYNLPVVSGRKRSMANISFKPVLPVAKKAKQ